jgi:phosphatidylglycerophosphate synthase
MADKRFQEATREQVSFLAPLEKKCLIWLAAHMPAWINPDHLTVLGLAAMLGAGLSYWYASISRAGLLLAIACLAINWFGDSLDGTLARFRNKQRPKYGFYVDHVVDALGTFFLLAGLGFSGYMSERIAAGLLIVYFLLSIEVYLATYTLGSFHLSFWKFSPTELRLLLIIGNLALMRWPMGRIFGYTYPLFDIGGVVGFIGMSLMLIVAIARHTAALYRAERV